MNMAFAQAASQAVTGTGASSSGTSMTTFFIQIIAIMALFYFLMIHPQKKEKKKREDLLNSIQRGDKVLTRGGLYGTVADIKENILVIKISENTKIEIERSYVENVQKNT
jgi:preprotein translocase subunit YajC